MKAKSDSVSAVSRGARHFISGTMLSRISGLLRDLVMAAAFGSSSSVAAFLMAFRFSHLPRRLFGEGAMHSAFIPQFEALRLKDSGRAADLFRHMVLGLGALLGLITLLGEAIVVGWLLFGTPSLGTRQILLLTGLMLPVLLFVCLYGMNSALLNCERVFFLPSLAPALLNIAWMIAALMLWGMAPDRAMIYLSLAIVIGGALQWSATMPGVVRSLRRLRGEGRTSYRQFWRSADLRDVAQPLFLGILGVGAAQINSALDPIFARIADPEGPALLWYAIRLQQLPLALFGISLARVLLPPLSRAVKEGQLLNARHLLGFAVRRATAVMLPLTIAIAVAGVAAVNLVYGRGEFDVRATLETARCLWAYGAGLLPMTLVMILAAPLYAVGDYRTPALAGAGAVGINAALNALFVFAMGWGALSVALATTIAAVCQCLLLGLALRGHRCGLRFEDWLASGVKVGVSALAGGVVVWLLRQGGGDLPRDLFGQLWQFALEGGLFLVVLLVVAWLVKARDILALIPLVRSIKI
jgi:putative peptidoglycan lipid II flippase